MQSTSKLVLPTPTYTRPDPSKKSHARKQPTGHIPRPRNAFILFRCDFVRQKKIPESVETDHRNISRIVGRIWRGMTSAQKQPWVKMAEEEKAQHMKIHPGYRFTRGTGAKRKTKQVDETLNLKLEDLPALYPDEARIILERPASCPPGSVRIPAVNLDAYTGSAKTRDDLSRRPSRVILYQTIPTPGTQEDSDLFNDVINHHYLEETHKEHDQVVKERDAAESSKRAIYSDNDHERFFCYPRMPSVGYGILGFNIPPEWESNGSNGIWNNWPQVPNLSNVVPPFDVNGYLNVFPASGSSPTFTDPFSSSVPPLPSPDNSESRHEEDRRTSPIFSERKESTFFSPRSRTYKLPLPFIGLSTDPASSDVDDYIDGMRAADEVATFPNRLSNVRRSLDASNNEILLSQPAQDIVGETTQGYSDAFDVDSRLSRKS